MKRVKEITKTVILTVIGIITLFNIYNLVNTKVLNQDLTTINSYAVLEVVSGSMNPNIKIGDLVFIDTNYETINAGDIITFKDESNLFITHRVIMKEGNTLLTKGDANNTVDKPIKTTDVVGKYSFKIPYVGNILASLRSPFTLTVILLFGTFVCIVLSMDAEDNEEASIIVKPSKKKANNEKKETKKVVKKASPKKNTKKTTTKKNTSKKTK